MTADPIAEAQREAAEAAELAKALEERVRQGDDSVTAEELANAESLGRFARLRVEAAERKVASKRADAAIAKGKALAGRLPSIEAEDAELVEAWVAAAQAMGRLSKLAQERINLIEEFSRNITDTDEQMRREAGVGIDSVGVLPQDDRSVPGFRVPDTGVDVTYVRLGRLLASAVHEGLDEKGRQEIADPIKSREIHLAAVEGRKITGWPEAIQNLQADA